MGFVWDPLENVWEQGFAALKKFKAREGHCVVPFSHVEGTFNLGKWVARQRRRNDKNIISTERKRRLDAIGFVWHPIEDAWEKGFAALMKFKKREGDCLVPSAHVEGAFNLGRWVCVQRHNKFEKLLLPERKARLDRIGFVWMVRPTRFVARTYARPVP